MHSGSSARPRLGRFPAVSLERALSKLGIAARPVAREWIRAGRVRVGERVVSDPAFRVDLRRDRIWIDGRRALAAAPQYWMLHKPAGYVTTRRDPDGRPTVHDLLPPHLPHLSAVGRLDLDSSGLLLLTNDSQLGARLTDPSSHVTKIYEVRLDAPIRPAEAARLAAGVVVLGRRTRPAEIELLGSAPARRVRVALVEGRNRQVRRMFATAGRRVEKLHRVGIGPLQLAGLPPGTARPLRPAELRALRTAAFGPSGRTGGRESRKSGL